MPFRKGEIMTIVSKDEEQWWTARNSLGQTGSIPVPYVVKVKHFYDQIRVFNTNIQLDSKDIKIDLFFAYSTKKILPMVHL